MKSCPHCGGELAKPRSPSDHRRFFAVIAAAFQHWPERHEFTPDDSEHLRKWLTAKAGYRTSIFVETPTDDAARQSFIDCLAAALKDSDEPAFIVPYRDGAAIIRAKSIDWHTLGQREFASVRSAVEDVIKAETGLDSDQLLREAERAA